MLRLGEVVEVEGEILGLVADVPTPALLDHLALLGRSEVLAVEALRTVGDGGEARPREEHRVLEFAFFGRAGERH